MKFKLASSILALFALIGFWVIVFAEFESNLIVLICVVLYVIIPVYGAYGIWVKSRNGIFVSLLFFVMQSVRSIGTDSLIPNIAPISISVPLGNFSNGQGYLIDFFAIFMAVLLAWLLKEVATPNKPHKLD